MALVATPGAANANSYLTEAEASTYFSERVALVPAWTSYTVPQREAALIMATRMVDAMLQYRRNLMACDDGCPSRYLTRRTWTGAPTTTTQRLAWPRTGMTDRNGNVIDSMAIPQDLKDAVAEFAGQLMTNDFLLDNDVMVQGITSIRAGSVSLTFSDNVKEHVMPNAVFNLMVPTWFTDEIITNALGFDFEVIGWR